MRLSATAVILGVAATMACSSQRKLSQVGNRELASISADNSVLSPLREKISGNHQFAKFCPEEIRNTLPVLVTERVGFPACPAKLGAAFIAAKDILKSEERTVVEELLGSRCHSMSGEFGTSPLVALLESIVPGSEASPLPEEEMRLRTTLREGLQLVRTVHEPIEQWIRLHGEFVMPEEELEFFYRLVSAEKCKMSDQEVDQSYRALHNLETLSRIQPEDEPQRLRMERFLAGVHKVIDRKIREYFRK